MHTRHKENCQQLGATQESEAAHLGVDLGQAHVRLDELAGGRSSRRELSYAFISQAWKKGTGFETELAFRTKRYWCI